jgi:hypothetical protein
MNDREAKGELSVALSRYQLTSVYVCKLVASLLCPVLWGWIIPRDNNLEPEGFGANPSNTATFVYYFCHKIENYVPNIVFPAGWVMNRQNLCLGTNIAVAD